MASPEIHWLAPEFEYREKDVAWYWISIIIACAIIAFAVWEKNFLFGFFVVVAEILLVTWGNETPPMIAFALTEKKIEIAQRKYYFLSEMESFSVNPIDDAWTEIFFTFKAKFKANLKIMAPSEQVDEIRKSLKTTLKEIDYQPSLLESLEKIIGF